MNTIISRFLLTFTLTLTSLALASDFKTIEFTQNKNIDETYLTVQRFLGANTQHETETRVSYLIHGVDAQGNPTVKPAGPRNDYSAAKLKALADQEQVSLKRDTSTKIVSKIAGGIVGVYVDYKLTQNFIPLDAGGWFSGFYSTLAFIVGMIPSAWLTAEVFGWGHGLLFISADEHTDRFIILDAIYQPEDKIAVDGKPAYVRIKALEAELEKIKNF